MRGGARVGIGCLGAVVLLVAAPAACVMVVGNPPSDARMIARLENRMDAFERLIVMCREDQIAGAGGGARLFTYSTRYWPEPFHGISEARQVEYRRLMRRIGGAYGVSCLESEVSFAVYDFGLSISGWTKGYVYQPREEDIRVLPSLDDGDAVWEGQSSYAIAYRAVGDGWYLIYTGT